MKLLIPAGSTSETVNVLIADSSSPTGAGLTGLTFSTSGLVAAYTFRRTAATSISLATLAAVTSAYSSGGFKEIDAVKCPGLYRLDIPDALLAAGNGRFVNITLQGAANMVPLTIEIITDPIAADVRSFGGFGVTFPDSGNSLPCVTVSQFMNSGNRAIPPAFANAVNSITFPDTVASPSDLTVTPVYCTVSPGEVRGSALVGYKAAAFNFTFVVVDSNGDPINLTGKTCKMTVAANATAVGSYTITGTVGGTSHNQVNVISTDTHTATAGTFHWNLRNTTDDTMLALGSLEIRPAADAI